MEQVTIQTTRNGRQIYRRGGRIIGGIVYAGGLVWHIHAARDFIPHKSFNPFDVHGDCCAVKHKMSKNHA